MCRQGMSADECVCVRLALLEGQINGGQFKTKVANGPFVMVLSWRPFAIKAVDDVSATFIEYR